MSWYNVYMNREDIKKLRLNLGMSQQAFSNKVGVSLMTVNRWETGNFNPSGLALKRLEKLQRKYDRTQELKIEVEK